MSYSLTKKDVAKLFDDYMKGNKMKYYLIKESDTEHFTGGNPFREECYTKEVERIELTPDDYGLILDALYEGAALHESCVALSAGPAICHSDYSDSMRKVAKKFEKIFGDSND